MQLSLKGNQEMQNWTIGTCRQIKGVTLERHYRFFRELATGRILHAQTIEELEEQIKKSSLNK